MLTYGHIWLILLELEADKDPSRTDARWWLDRKTKDDGTKVTDREPHETIFALLATYKPDRDRRRRIAVENAQAYGISLNRLGEPLTMSEDKLTYNAAENAVDTLVAKTSKTKVLPMAVTSGGTRELRRRTKRFNRFIEGLFAEQGVYKKDPQWVLDMLLFHCAIAQVHEGAPGEPIQIDRVMEFDCDVDEHDARDGDPRCFYRSHWVDKLVLAHAYRKDPHAVQAIQDYKFDAQDNEETTRSTKSSDMIRVTDAWHLPSGKGAGDGRWVQCIRSATLADEEFKDAKLPFVFMYRKRPVQGIWGQPLMSSLAPQQRSFDKITLRIDECHDLLGVPRLLCPRQANVDKSQLDDMESSAIDYDGDKPPTEWNAQPITPDAYSYRTSIPTDMLKFIGLSEMSAMGNIPPGVTAAKALQMSADVESERLGPMWNCREDFYCDLTILALDAARRKAKSSGGYVVKTADRRIMESIDINDIDIGPDEYEIQVFPTSLLSKTPSAKYDQLSEMRQRGDIDEDEFRHLLDMPDLDAENDLETSAVDILDMVIDSMLVDGVPCSAEAFDDWGLIVSRGAKAYNLERVRAATLKGKDLRESRRNLGYLRDYIVSAQNFMKPPAPDPMAMPSDPNAVSGVGPPAPMGAVGPGGAPMGAPPVVPGAGIPPMAPPSAMPPPAPVGVPG